MADANSALLESPPAALGPSASGTLNCFSVDVEEYFHCEAFAQTVPQAQWLHLERRAKPRIDRIAELLDRTDNRGTFFVLGWMVEFLKPCLRELHAAGHEIACHGDGHAHLSRMTPDSLRTDLRTARRRIEDAIGARVSGYRAPTFSLTRATAWAADVLCEEDFQYDSSIFPIRHDRYGVPEAPCSPFWLKTRTGSRLLELPPLTLDWKFLRVPVGGGGYLRLLPGGVVRAAIAGRQRRGAAAMIYVHPWELDPQQPHLPAAWPSRWRHRVNLHRTEGKLAALLGRFRFDTAHAVAGRVRVGPTLPTFAFDSNEAQTDVIGAVLNLDQTYGR
jgi:polysaccharide deacetylase family protein (PEP-CTERM system associated)